MVHEAPKAFAEIVDVGLSADARGIREGADLALVNKQDQYLTAPIGLTMKTYADDFDDGFARRLTGFRYSLRVKGDLASKNRMVGWTNSDN